MLQLPLVCAQAILSGFWLARYLSARAFVAKFIGLVAALAAGYFIGREGPMVHLSAALSVLLMKLPPFDEVIDNDHQRKRAMLGAACAVGVVATFGTPIGGVLFSVEVTATYYMVNNLWRGFLGAIACIVCFQALQDADLIESVTPSELAFVPHVSWQYLAFALLGALQGMLSGAIVQLMSLIAQTLRQSGLLRPVAPRVLTAFTICIAAAASKFVIPNAKTDPIQVLDGLFAGGPLLGSAHASGGHSGAAAGTAAGTEAGTAAAGGPAHGGSWSVCDTPLSALLGEGAAAGHGGVACSPEVGLALYAVVETLLLLFSIVIPVPSGCFMPIFVLGAVTGRLFGALLRDALGYDEATLPDAVFAVVGSAALTAGTTATLSTALITLELTGQQELLHPVLLGVIVSCGVSGMFSKSIYDQILVLKGLPYMPHLSDNLRSERLYHMTARDIMRPTTALVAATKTATATNAADGAEGGGEGGSSGDAGAPRTTALERLLDVPLPLSHRYHPANSASLASELDLPLMPLAYDMSVREVLAGCRTCRDRYIPLIESRHVPTLLGALTRTQLVEWFSVEVEIGEEEAEEEEMALRLAGAQPALIIRDEAQQAGGGEDPASSEPALPEVMARPSTSTSSQRGMHAVPVRHVVPVRVVVSDLGQPIRGAAAASAAGGGTPLPSHGPIPSGSSPDGATSVLARLPSARLPAPDGVASSAASPSAAQVHWDRCSASVGASRRTARRTTKAGGAASSSGGARRNTLANCNPEMAFQISECGIEGNEDGQGSRSSVYSEAGSHGPPRAACRGIALDSYSDDFSPPPGGGADGGGPGPAPRARSRGVSAATEREMRRLGSSSLGSSSLGGSGLGGIRQPLLSTAEKRSDAAAADDDEEEEEEEEGGAEEVAVASATKPSRAMAARVIQAMARSAQHRAAHYERVSARHAHGAEFHEGRSSAAAHHLSDGRNHLFPHMESLEESMQGGDGDGDDAASTALGRRASASESADATRGGKRIAGGAACGAARKASAQSAASVTSDPRGTGGATAAAHGKSSGDPLDGIEKWLGDLGRPFPWDEIEWNRCALQLSSQTALDEIHNLFSFMNIGTVWVTAGGRLEGVVTDRAIIDLCLQGGSGPPPPAAGNA